jgi:hypothetical protein
MFERIGQSVSQGIELVLRGGATPFVLGMRWHGWRRLDASDEAPRPRRGLGVASKVALDEIFFAAEIVSAELVALWAHRRVGAEVASAFERFGAEGWLAQPESYHVAPPPLRDRDVALRDARSRFFRHRHASWESGYAPHRGEPGRTRWLGYEATRTAHARLLEHDGPARPWVVCVPGYRMGHHAVDFTGFRARWLHHTLGLNVAIPVMPLHGPRRIGRRGGDGWFAGDFLDMVHAQAQAVFDLRRLVGWLRDRGATAVGVHGVSLGGHTSALLASLDGALDCVIAGIPAADLLRLLRAHVPAPLLRATTRFGLDLDAAARILRVVSPLCLTPRVPHERRFLYAGTADRLADPTHALDLWRHWDRPRLAWYHGGHVSFLWEREVETILLEAFERGGLLRG